jgi:hypothetical protein
MRKCEVVIARALRFWLLPKGTGLPNLFQSRENFGPVLKSLGEIVRLQAPFEVLAGKNPEQIVQWNNAVPGGRIEIDPIANVFFRPEEIHGASGIAEILIPSPERHSYIGHDGLRFHAGEGTVLDLHLNRRPAIQTG